MNKKINEAKYEIAYVLGEFQLKLDNYLRNHDAYCDVSCYAVKINSPELLSDEVISEIEELFYVELESYEVEYDSKSSLKEVWYKFAHKKLS